MQRWAGLIGLVLAGLVFAPGDGHGADTLSLEQVRPRTGGQLYVQRLATLQAGQFYSRILSSAFANQWRADWQPPTHEQWQSLLAYEAAMMADRQGLSPLTIVVGDSLCLWLAPEQLSGDRLWLNQSISGETTGHMVRRLNYFATTQPNRIVVMAGVNDLKNGVDPRTVVSNLELIVQRLSMQHRQTQIVVLSILPTRLPNISAAVVGQVNQQLAIAVQRRGARFADLQPAFRDNQGQLRTDLTTDGLHLNPQGYSLLATYLAGL